ncbi:MAG: hypothetical protein HFF50_05300 [Lawsonibacter sp.]|nr:hypothetical protein [Lawsonibacter sp.]
MHKKPSMPPAGEAILSGDMDTVRRMEEDGSLLFRKGGTVELRRNIPTVVKLGGKEMATYSDAFCFALAHDQAEYIQSIEPAVTQAEQDVFHPAAAWETFIQNLSYYINRAVMWEFD